MMSCNCNGQGDIDPSTNCVCSTVLFIHELQESVSDPYPTIYDVPFLGSYYKNGVPNTRPFILFTQSGPPLEAYVPIQNPHFKSPIFRVESVDKSCSAVLRALIVISGENLALNSNPVYTYLTIPHAKLRGTSSFITVDLTCFSGIQCLRDAIVPND